MLNFKRSTSVIGRPFIITSNRLTVDTIVSPTINASSTVQPSVAPVILSLATSETSENHLAETFRSDDIALNITPCDNESGGNANKKKKKKKKVCVGSDTSKEENTDATIEDVKLSQKTKFEVTSNEEASIKRASESCGLVVKQGKKSRGSSGTQRSEDVDEYKGGGGWSLDQLVDFIDNGRKPRVCLWGEENSASNTELMTEDKNKSKHELFVQRRKDLIESDSGFGDWTPHGIPCEGKEHPRSPSSITTEGSEKGGTPPITGERCGVESPDGGVFLELHVEDLLRSLGAQNHCEFISDIGDENSEVSDSVSNEPRSVDELHPNAEDTGEHDKLSSQSDDQRLSAESYEPLRNSLIDNIEIDDKYILPDAREDKSQFVITDADFIYSNDDVNIAEFSIEKEEADFVVVRQKRRKPKDAGKDSDQMSENRLSANERVKYVNGYKNGETSINGNAPGTNGEFIEKRRQFVERRAFRKAYPNSRCSNSHISNSGTADRSETSCDGRTSSELVGQNNSSVKHAKTGYASSSGRNFDSSRRYVNNQRAPQYKTDSLRTGSTHCDADLPRLGSVATAVAGVTFNSVRNPVSPKSSECGGASGVNDVNGRYNYCNLEGVDDDNKVCDTVNCTTVLSNSSSSSSTTDDSSSLSSQSGFHLRTAQEYMFRGFEEVLLRMKKDPISVIIFNGCTQAGRSS